ncbi:globin domain-containing protein [Streptomyces sp. NPDC052051]|uniref:globin domain-containing protein n=1 Tax=Streptomyces sp. NPDC052051 TaxID=3154649 RepID=UPI00342DF97B
MTAADEIPGRCGREESTIMDNGNSRTRDSRKGDEYHALLARRDAMRLRDQMLAPSRAAEKTKSPTYDAYDGAADQELIVQNLAAVTPFDELIAHLYDAMFERHPYLRQLFPESMEFQKAHLERAFWFLIEHLHKPEEITAFCSQLGRDHRKLGVQPVHFQVFEAALGEALYRCSGGRIGQDVEQAWLRMVRFAAAGMVEGSKRALAEPPAWHGTVTSHQLRRPDLAVIRVRTAEPYPYRPGQYATLESPLLPHTWRPYTFATVPAPDGELEFHIRRTGPGGVSDAMTLHTRVGDTLRLGPPQGTATLDDEQGRDVLIVAGGTGWATGRALLEDLSQRRAPGRRAHLFLGVRTAEDLYDAQALSRLENRCPWLRVVPVISDGPGASADGSVAEAIARHGDFSQHIAYVSGPPAMVTAAVWRLAGLGLPADRIRHDPVAGMVPLPSHAQRTRPTGPAVGHLAEGAQV